MLRRMPTTAWTPPGGWRALRAALGLKQYEMAIIMGARPQTVRRLENGDVQNAHRASLILLKAWCEYTEGKRRLLLAGYPVEALKWSV